jgi:hypothetical protein
MDKEGKNNEEDNYLKQEVKRYESPNWEAIGEAMQAKGFQKNHRQCRDRYD